MASHELRRLSYAGGRRHFDYDDLSLEGSGWFSNARNAFTNRFFSRPTVGSQVFRTGAPAVSATYLQRVNPSWALQRIAKPGIQPTLNYKSNYAAKKAVFPVGMAAPQAVVDDFRRVVDLSEPVKKQRKGRAVKNPWQDHPHANVPVPQQAKKVKKVTYGFEDGHQNLYPM